MGLVSTPEMVYEYLVDGRSRRKVGVVEIERSGVQVVEMGS
jgi:hypothetical protein